MVGWLVSWLVGWLAGWLVGWLVGCIVLDLINTGQMKRTKCGDLL